MGKTIEFSSLKGFNIVKLRWENFFLFVRNFYNLLFNWKSLNLKQFYMVDSL